MPQVPQVKLLCDTELSLLLLNFLYSGSSQILDGVFWTILNNKSFSACQLCIGTWQ